MNNFPLDLDEVVLFKEVGAVKRGETPVDVLLTNKRFVLMYKVKRFFIKEETQSDTYSIAAIKIYQGTPQIKVKDDTAEIYLTSQVLNMQFASKGVLKRFVTELNQVITGKTDLERGAESVYETVAKVDRALGFNALETIRAVAEKGVLGSVLDGVSAVSNPATSNSSNLTKVLSFTKAALDTTEVRGKETKEVPSGSTDIDSQFEQLKKLKALLDTGAINDEEYSLMKSKILGV